MFEKIVKRLRLVSYRNENMEDEKNKNEYESLKKENRLLKNRLSTLSRYIDTCSIVGEKHVAIKKVKDIITSNKLV